ncbi:GNAT family N-acetyltransferase [Nocardioides pyridinolyticus]
MDIQQVTWDEADAVRRSVDVLEAVRLHEEPWAHPSTATAVALNIRHGWDGEPADHLLVTVDGTDVATATYETTTYDNLHVAWLGVDVHPEHRRRGHGSAIVEHLMDRARRDGKTSVGMDSWELPGLPEFAAQHGFERKQVAVNRRQHLAKVDRAELDRLHDAALAAATDYELVRRVGATPEAELPALVTLTEAGLGDAARDDLVDQVGVEPGAGQHLGHRVPQEDARVHAGQLPVALAERSADGVDDDRRAHGTKLEHVLTQHNFLCVPPVCILRY